MSARKWFVSTALSVGAGCGAAWIGLASPQARAAEPPPPAPKADVAEDDAPTFKNFPGEAHLLAAMDRVEGALKSTEVSVQQIEAREALVESSYAHALIPSPAAKAELLKAQRQLALFRQTPDRAALRKAGDYLSLAMRLAPEAEESTSTPAVTPTSTAPAASLSSPQATLVPRTLRSTPAPTPGSTTSGSTWPQSPSTAPPPVAPALAATTATTYDWNSTAAQPPQTATTTKTEVHYHYAPAPPPPPVIREEVHVYPGYGYGYYPYGYYGRPYYHHHPRPVYVAPPPPGVSVRGSNWGLRFNF